MKQKLISKKVNQIKFAPKNERTLTFLINKIFPYSAKNIITNPCTFQLYGKHINLFFYKDKIFG